MNTNMEENSILDLIKFNIFCCFIHILKIPSCLKQDNECDRHKKNITTLAR